MEKTGKRPILARLREIFWRLRLIIAIIIFGTPLIIVLAVAIVLFLLILAVSWNGDLWTKEHRIDS